MWAVKVVPQGLGDAGWPLVFLSQQRPRYCDLQSAIAARYGGISDSQVEILVSSHTPRDLTATIWPGDVISYQLTGGRTLRFHESRLDSADRGWKEFSCLFLPNSKIGQVLHFISEILGYPEDDILLRVGPRYFSPDDVIFPDGAVYEVVRTGYCPLHMTFEVALNPIGIFPINLWFAEDAKVCDAAVRLEPLLRVHPYFVKFTTSGGELLEGSRPLAPLRHRRLQVKPISNIVWFVCPILKSNPFRHQFTAFPNFSNALGALQLEWKLERDCNIEVRFGDRLINEDDNLAVLESNSSNPIKVMTAVKISYEILCCRYQRLCSPRSTINDFLINLRKDKIFALQIRDPDNTDEILNKDRLVATFAGKVLPVFCEGERVKFKLVFDDGSRLKPDINLPPTAGDAKLALVSRYGHRFPGVLPDMVTLCSFKAEFKAGDRTSVMDRHVFFVITDRLYVCQVRLRDRIWREEFPGHAMCGNVRSRLIESGAIPPNKPFALILKGKALSDTAVMARVFFRQNVLILTIETSEVECSIKIGDAALHIWVDNTWTVGQLRKMICCRLVFTNPEFEILCDDHPQADNTVLGRIKHFQSSGLVINFKGSVSLSVAFWDISRNLRMGPMTFPLNATFQDAAAQMRIIRPGNYTFYRSLDDRKHALDEGMRLHQISWTTDEIPFHFEARVLPHP
jgi:hypothetical protein